MNILPVFKPFLIALTATAFASETSPVNAQANPKKVRIGVSETHVGYLPLQVAFHKAITKMRASTLVRASLRGLLFLSDARNRDEVVQIIMKQHNVSDRQLAEQMLGYSFRVVTKEAHVTNAEVQYLIDLLRATAKVTRPVSVEQVVDFSFLEKRRELGLIR